ncbi:MAG TPA: sensor histidine kinase [Streptosporangiaceae bacterium]|nr:sensor histidine kinase [Streptosporangiaceae bacterium]
MDGVAAAWRRWWRSPARDVVLVGVLTVILVYGTYGEGHPSPGPNLKQFHGHPVPHPTAALALVAVACLALAWRRRYPVTVLAVSTAAVTVYSLLGYVNGAALIAPVIALYAVATQLSALRAIALGVVTVGALMAATAARNPFGQISGGGYYLIPIMGVGVLFGGIALTNRRAYAASIRDRAEQDARRQVDEERLRIARELHDVVAHTMATINVQAGVAAHVLPTQPEAVAEALQAIKSASKEGLRELRAILNVLRQADDTDPVQPAPGLAQLDALVEGARRAGLPITLAVSGEPFPLPAAVDLAAYRIVQESLTNVIRHAGPADAAVRLRYHRDEIAIDVTDTGHGPSAGPGAVGGTAGHGQAGMRERAAAVGGTVQTGPRPGGGYQVTARLPVHGRLTSASASASAAPPAAPVEGTAP